MPNLLIDWFDFQPFSVTKENDHEKNTDLSKLISSPECTLKNVFCPKFKLSTPKNLRVDEMTKNILILVVCLYIVT